MARLRRWFDVELQRLGFGGLEDIFMHLETMPDDQVAGYLQNVLGEQAEVKTLAAAFVTARSDGQRPVGSGTRAISNGESQPTWDTMSGTGKSSTTKKGKRRGKNRAGSSNGNGSKHNTGKTSFASAVAGQGSSTSNSGQAQAIRNSAAEQIPRKIREYQRSKKCINCVYCGYIEKLIREDGACSFCQRPIFSIYGSEHEASNMRTRANQSSNRTILENRTASKQEKGGKETVSQATDVQDRDILVSQVPRLPDTDSSDGFYRNPSLPQSWLEECLNLMTIRLSG
ncbi:unnamed protein product [Chondrus crispus]|uniref:Zinc finger C2HC5-type domain-containing protein n=1 Tax=Chondrus crispus TaxID=2769 RepID=R7QT22_CHOCR|nr:unnamed protein product [Chondrus crispus]CDF40495.1 unnamed protein product [Chondrus crispus]|eukprot:XP_005710789.1 unnamed protein product [Chondrus crispus]